MFVAVGVRKAKVIHERDPNIICHPYRMKQLTRAIYVIGHLCKMFDFDDADFKGKNQSVNNVLF